MFDAIAAIMARRGALRALRAEVESLAEERRALQTRIAIGVPAFTPNQDADERDRRAAERAAVKARRAALVEEIRERTVRMRALQAQIRREEAALTNTYLKAQRKP